MKDKPTCIFDLDGTLYEKESPITYEIRRRVVELIALKKECDFETAKKVYKELPRTFPNPYHGLASVGITGPEYQEIFNFISVDQYVKKDNILLALFKELSEVASIQILSFAPQSYVIKMLKHIGVYSEIEKINSVSAESNWQKNEYYSRFNDIDHNKRIVYVIGDDYINDILPALNCGHKTRLVNFQEPNNDIYSIIAKICSELKEYRVPSTIRVEVSSYCNERCVICPYNQRKAHGIMDINLFETIISQHVEETLYSKIIFPSTIGEPFLFCDFFKYVEIANKYYSSIATFSNATLLDESTVQKYIDSGGTELMLTLHGYHKIDFEKITQSNMYNQVKSNILTCAEVNMKNNYPLTIYLDIYSDYSDLEKENYIKRLIELGVRVNLLRMEQTHNWAGKIEGSLCEIQHECTRIASQFGVRFDGTVVPCCADINGDYILGDAKKESLKEIFNGRRYIMLQSLSNAKLLKMIPFCRYCNI